jgi:hypothetical protein
MINKMFGSNKDEISNQLRMLPNEELHLSYRALCVTHLP